MASKLIEYVGFEGSMRQTEAELLEALLRKEEETYPWNPALPSSEAYFASLEHEFELEGWSEEEIGGRTQTLFAQINQCWQQPQVVDKALKESLFQRFANRVPKAWLEAIFEEAKQVFSTNLTRADQLVKCVSPLLLNWGEDDLEVFARPFAYAMRGTDLEVVRPVDWSELSEMEKARLSIAIAHYALRALSNED